MTNNANDNDLIYFLNLLNNNKFGVNNKYYKPNKIYLKHDDIKLIKEFLENELIKRENNESKQFKTLCDTKNRRNNRMHVRKKYYLPELGYNNSNIKFYNSNNSDELIGMNYNRILYGDHGPYIEFNKEHINWNSFKHNIKNKGDSVAYYNEYYTSDKNVKLYEQLKTVRDQPNPPKGKYSVNNNRSNGYADYIVGKYYISPDNIIIHENDENVPYLYLLINKVNNNNRNSSIKVDNIMNEYNRLIDEKSAESKEFRVFKPTNLKINIQKPMILRGARANDIIRQCIAGTYIPGLIYVPDFITDNEHESIKQVLIKNYNLWDLGQIQQKRRSLHFGYSISFDNMELYKCTGKLAEIPKEFKWIPQRIQRYVEERIHKKIKAFNQLILNEYTPNQGINAHVDRTHCFGPVICGLSLFSHVVMEFKNKKTDEVKPIVLLPKSLYIMSGESRYEWLHSINRDKIQKFYGNNIIKGLRYSMTYRHAIIANSETLSRNSYNERSAHAWDL
mmetsp:Transcript_104172/g.127277  ORF Transcript_104172/g.127277 Transcript_104172/m.127277 type:complete len:505 (+) Transcript_104172:3-1517(+)